MVCGRSSVRVTPTIQQREPGNNDRLSLRNSVRIIEAFDDGAKIQPTRPTTYLNDEVRIQPMIYTMNCIELLQNCFDA